MYEVWASLLACVDTPVIEIRVGQPFLKLDILWAIDNGRPIENVQ